jgi:hypothetical protein
MKDKNKIKINTGLSGFVMIDAIISVGDEGIKVVRSFDRTPVYEVIEALAQTGALYIRRLTGFNKHIFLLKIEVCDIPAGPLQGKFVISAELAGRSESAFRCSLRGEGSNGTVIEGSFLYASSEYGEKFDGKILRDHYEKVFSCLLKDTYRD